MKLELIPVIRYWEWNSKEIFSSLQRAKDLGARTVCAWVPWQQLETDRLHLLQKFLKQAFTLGLRVKLGITPELAIGYTNAGIPDDLLRDSSNLAHDRLGQPIYGCAPPNIHPLVSLLAPHVFQRYGHFLLKLTQELQEVLAEGFQGELELVVTDSLFKYYRNLGLPESDHGDFSLRHMQVGAGYRKEEWTPALAERIFHSRAVDFLESRFSRNAQVKVISHKLATRDASLERLLEELTLAGIDSGKLFQQMIRQRGSASLAWLDDLSSLRDRERNFLISSLLLAYQELWISWEDYLDCSVGFRRKLERIEQGLASEQSNLARPAAVLVQNRFAPARITQILQEKLGVSLKVQSALADLRPDEKEGLQLLAVEEAYPLEYRQFQEIMDLGKKQDCAVVFFRSSLCELALSELKNYKSFRLNHAWSYEVILFPSGGHALVIEGQEDQKLSMDTLCDSLLNVAKVKPFCSFDRSQGLFSVGVDWKLDGERMKTLFFMNPTREEQSIHLEFEEDVFIHGLQQNKAASHQAEDAMGRSFETKLPAFSVIPFTVVMPAKAEKVEQDGTAAELA